MINFIRENFWNIFMGLSLLLNFYLVWLCIRYSIFRQERKYRVLKLTKILIKYLTGETISDEDMENIIFKINEIESVKISSIDEKREKNIERMNKQTSLTNFIKTYFKNKHLDMKERNINLIAEILVNFVKRFGK